MVRFNSHPFNRFITSIKRSAKEVPRRCRKKYVDPNIDADYLQKIFEEQNRRCFWTGVLLDINLKKGRMAMSVDRINPKEDYIVGNLCFTYVFFNIGRSSASVEETIEFIKYSGMQVNSNLKNYKIINKTGVNVYKSPTILMDSILYGATSGNKEGVEALVNQYSNDTTKSSKINKPKKSSKAAAERKKKHFLDNCLNLIDVKNEPTMSVKDYMIQQGSDEAKASVMDRFYSSKLSTDLESKGVRMVDTGEGKQTDRLHLILSDLN